MALALTKNAALNGFTFMMTSSSTHAPASGLNVAGSIAKDGGTFSSLVNTPSEIAFGFYKVNLTATDTNANVVALRMTAPGADDLGIVLLTQT